MWEQHTANGPTFYQAQEFLLLFLKKIKNEAMTVIMNSKDNLTFRDHNKTAALVQMGFFFVFFFITSTFKGKYKSIYGNTR